MNNNNLNKTCKKCNLEKSYDFFSKKQKSLQKMR